MKRSYADERKRFRWHGLEGEEAQKRALADLAAMGHFESLWRMFRCLIRKAKAYSLATED